MRDMRKETKKGKKTQKIGREGNNGQNSYPEQYFRHFFEANFFASSSFCSPVYFAVFLMTKFFSKLNQLATSPIKNTDFPAPLRNHGVK